MPATFSSEDFLQKAAECDQLATRVHFSRIAVHYRDLARRWRKMAHDAERLELPPGWQARHKGTATTRSH